MGHRRQVPRLLPAKLLAIRKHLNKSQSNMLTLLNIDAITARTRISEYENGTRHPSLLTLLRYSEASGVLINDLADDTVAVTELTFGKRKRRRQIHRRTS
jgi:transcriptional regulator with XRE-family HTH domain